MTVDGAPAEPSLPAKILAIDDALAGAPHAFGGALALAYYAEPRATIDIDLNVFVPDDRGDQVLTPLAGIGVETAGASAVAARDGQVRVWWGRTPIDVFFAYDAFHDEAARGVQRVPFADTSIPILGADHLVVCKVVFNRPKDWLDVETMLQLGAPLSTAEILRWVGRLVGDTDPRYDRVANLLTARQPGLPTGVEGPTTQRP